MAPIPIQSLNHIARETGDVARCTAFYRDVLGFREVPRPDFPFGGAWLAGHGLMIHVIEGTPPLRPGEISTRADHVAFHTNDLDAVERLLTLHGVPFRRNTSPAPGITQVFFHDPDGNHIEVATYPAIAQAEALRLGEAKSSE